MLEAELASTGDSQIELQRSKDELRDTKEELAVAQSRIEKLEKESVRSVPVRRTSRTYTQPPVALSVSLSNSRAGAPTQRMTSSKSLKRIHGMLDQMKNLESRVATFKSTLPKPVLSTPSRHHIASPSLRSNTGSSAPRYRTSQDHLSDVALSHSTHHGHHHLPSTTSIPLTSNRSKRSSFSYESGMGTVGKTTATPSAESHHSQNSTTRSSSTVNNIVVPRTSKSPRTRHSVDMMSNLAIAEQQKHNYTPKHQNSSAINLGTTTPTPTKQRIKGSFYTHHKVASTASVLSIGSHSSQQYQNSQHPSFGVLHSRQSATLSHGTRM